MESSEKLSKKELKQLKKLHELESHNLEKRQSMIKWIVIGLASTLFFAFFTALVIVSKQSKKTEQAAVLTSEGHVRGDANASLTLVEFSDVQCPACQSYHPIVKKVLETYKGKVKLLYKHFPLVQAHKNAIAGAKAAEAAGKQGKFWEMVDVLFEKQREWEFEARPQEKFELYAKDIALDLEKFKKDLQDKAFEEIINKQREEGIAVGVNSTPTFFLNNKKLDSTNSLDGFKKVIDEELKK